MDVRAVLEMVKDRTGWSQRELARRSGVDQSRISAWERGVHSPSVATLNRVVAAAGLQIRPQLVALTADLDALVDAVLAAEPVVGWESLERLLDALTEELTVFHDEELKAAEREAREPVPCTEHVRWAFDGRTSLALQGLGFSADVPEVVAVLDEALRTWLFRRRAQPTACPPVSWFDATREELRGLLSAPLITASGMVQLRVVDQLGPVLRLLPEERTEALPVLASEAVEQEREDLGRVLGRLRELRHEGRNVA